MGADLMDGEPSSSDGPDPLTARERLSDRFDSIADRLTVALGSAWALIASALLIVVWATTGPVFGFSDTWQLFINTTTTIVTFLMVFVIQNSQNRQGKATQLKLDELIRALEGARNRFIELDTATTDELTHREQELVTVAESHPDGEVAEVDEEEPPTRDSTTRS